jgi:phosphopantothenoylcysteine decarboxylase
MNILLIATGSVATIKLIKLSRQLEASGFQVKIAATARAWWFIIAMLIRRPRHLIYFFHRWQPAVFEFFNYFQLKHGRVEHINLAKWAEAILIAPVSANTLAKIANGITDNFTLCLIRALPAGRKVFLAPAMNTAMWGDPAIVSAVKLIQTESFKKKYFLVLPTVKELFCGDIGVGAMAEIETIITEVKKGLM